MGVKIETVMTKDFSMDYFKFGKGENIMVILPGLSVQSVMGMADAVVRSYEGIAEQFTVYLFDRRKEIPSEYSVYDMGRDTAKAMKELGLKDILLFGASQGGMIAQVIAIEYPELVKKLALGSTSANVKPEQFKVIEEWINFAKKKDTEGLMDSFGKEIYPSNVYEMYKDTFKAMAQTVKDKELERFIILAEGIRGFNVVDRLSSIKCPVMVLGEFEDSVLDSDASMEIAEKLDEIGSLKLYLYNGFGHAVFDTAPDYKQRLLNFFLE